MTTMTGRISEVTPIAFQSFDNLAISLRLCPGCRKRRSTMQFKGDSTVCIRCANKVPKNGAKA